MNGLVKLTPVGYLLKYAEKGSVEGFYTEPDNNEIRPLPKPEEFSKEPSESGFGRVWNNGMGFLTIATFAKDGLLLLNRFLLQKDELIELTNELRKRNIKLEFIDLREPHFFKYNLNSYYQYLNKMKAMQKERNGMNFFQWLFK